MVILPQRRIMHYKINNKIKRSPFFPRPSSLCNKRGFTLIEIMVSVTIFTIIITVGMGALVSLLRNYEVTQAEKRVHDSLNYAMETITREIRLGKNYHINPEGIEVGGDDGFGSSIGFNASDNRGYVRYSLNGDVLQLERNGAETAPNGPSTLTDPTQVIVDSLRFTVLGTDTYGSGDLSQPLVWIQIQAYATNGDSERETTIQTLVSQRVLDF